MYSRARLFERVQLATLRFVGTFVAGMLAMWIRHEFFPGATHIPWVNYLIPSGLAALLVVIVMANVPVRPRSGLTWRGVFDAVRGVVIATMVLLAIPFFLRGETYSRASVLVFLPLAPFAILLAQELHIQLLARIRANVDASRRVLIVGFGEQGRRIAQALVDDPVYLAVVGYLDDGPGKQTEEPEGPVWPVSDLSTAIDETGADTVIVTSDGRTEKEMQDLVGVCMAANVEWMVVPTIFDLVLDRVRIDQVGGLPVVSQRGNRLVGHDWFLKRAFDLVVSAALLAVLSPLLAVIALGVKLTSPGPVIFRQARIGRDGEPFTFLKFRTMTWDADPGDHEAYATKWIVGQTGSDDEAGGGAVHKLQDDSRITSLGRILRASSLDELPQLWNVIRGDMSLVGPRPPIPYEFDRYTEWHRRRLDMPPGITGLWQVLGRNNVSFDEMVRLDLEYIERWSLRLDLNILLRTVPAVVLHRGS